MGLHKILKADDFKCMQYLENSYSLFDNCYVCPHFNFWVFSYGEKLVKFVLVKHCNELCHYREASNANFYTQTHIQTVLWSWLTLL